MADTAWASRRPGRRGLVIAGLTLTVLLVVSTLGAVTMAWGSGMRAQERLLPGTTIAGVDVGAQTVDRAITAVQAEIAEDLDRPIEITHDGQRWTTSARRLGATADVEQAIAVAYEHTTKAGLVDLVRHRLAGGDHHPDHEIALDVPADAVAAFVAGIAGDVDRPPKDAVVTWTEDGARVQDAVTGRRVQRDATVEAVIAAVEGGARQVELPVDENAPTVGTDQAQQLADDVDALVANALDHQVTVELADDTRTVTPRRLGATTNAEALIASGDPAADDVELTVPDEAVATLVDEIEAGHEVAARDATLEWSPGGGFSATPGATGLAVDDEDARAAIAAALQGETDRVKLQLVTTHPSITTDRFDQVLLVRQGKRRVELYRDGQVVRSWAVAVGTGNHPTPTGMFTIGVKRYEPTWVNPSPNSWGNDMPARIGPGPDNPLGLRALNWYQDGHDTLIRFHGTANVASIGRAASHGCVRMRNADVIELYDLVPEGTVIVSVAA